MTLSTAVLRQLFSLALREDTGQLNFETLPPGCVRFLAINNVLAVATAAPAKPVAVVQTHLIGLRLHQALQKLRILARHSLIVNYETHFRIDFGGAWIKVKRADKKHFIINDKSLGMQRCLCRGCVNKLRALDISICTHLVEHNAGFQQRFSRRRIATVHRELVIGGQRVGYDAHVNTARLQVGERRYAVFPRHKVRGYDEHLALRGQQGISQRCQNGSRFAGPAANAFVR